MMKRIPIIAIALTLAATPALARGGAGFGHGGGGAAHIGVAHGAGFRGGRQWHGYNAAIGGYRNGAVFQGYGRNWGYHPSFGGGGYGGAIAAGLIGLGLGFFAPQFYPVAGPTPLPVPVEVPVPDQQYSQDQPTQQAQPATGDILAAAGADREQQRRTIWTAAQAFCKAYPDDRICNAPQQGSPQ
jgi:hypothetical protein